MKIARKGIRETVYVPSMAHRADSGETDGLRCKGNPLSKVQTCGSSPFAQPMCLVSRASYKGRAGLHGVWGLAPAESHLYYVYCPRIGDLLGSKEPTLLYNHLRDNDP